ncbi:hypothetical protein LXL04_016828 [Taraxacum kok-saghyz]
MLTMLCFLNPLPGSISIATAYRSRSEKAKLEIQNFRNSEVEKAKLEIQKTQKHIRSRIGTLVPLSFEDYEFRFLTSCILFIRLRIQNPNSEGISCRTQNSISGYISLLRNRIQKFDFCYLSFLTSLMIFVDFRRKSEGNLEEISTSRRNYDNKVFSFLFIIKYA